MQHTQATSRRKRLAAVVRVLIAVALVLASAASATEGIMLQIKDAPLKEVVTLLTQQSGVNIVIVDESKLDKRVTATLNDVPLEKALDYVVKYSGVSCKKMEDGTYIIGGSLPEETPAISPDELTKLLPPVEPEPVQVPSKAEFTTIKLRHSKPSYILALMGWTGVNPDPGTELNSRRPHSSINGPGSNVINPGGGVYSLRRNGDVVPQEALGVRIENNQPVPPAYDPRGGNPGAGRTGDTYSGAGQYAPPRLPSGYPPTPTPNLRTPTPTPTPSPGGSQNFLLPDGVEQVQPFDLDNSIIVKATEEGLEKFKKIVRMLDVPPKQVQIKAEFIVITTTESKRFGIDWSLQRLNESFQTTFGPTGSVIFGFASGNLTAQLRAQLTTDVGRLVNSPIITTLNNRDAFINISNQIPYWVPINTVVGDNQIISQWSPQFIDVETSLHVVPRINGDNTITMQLDPQVSGTGDVVVGPDGSSIPATNNQSLFTERRVGNGETIVLGGFIRKHDSRSVQKIPILADLPIIGSLFRTTAKSTEDQELLIFVTPTILPDPAGGTVGSSLVP